MPKSGHVTGSTTQYARESAAEDTEGIVLENRNDLLLLQILASTEGFQDTKGRNAGSPIDGDVVARWDKKNRSGVSSFNYHLFAIAA
jgi:hypothetical protein